MAIETRHSPARTFGNQRCRSVALPWRSSTWTAPKFVSTTSRALTAQPRATARDCLGCVESRTSSAAGTRRDCLREQAGVCQPFDVLTWQVFVRIPGRRPGA